MTDHIEVVPLDDQIPLLDQTTPTNATKDEIEGRKVYHLIEIKETNEDRLASQTKKSANKIFDERFMDLDNTTIKSSTIFRVNVALRKSNPDAYTPKMISIGPYHKKNPELSSMEKYKLRYLQRFLQRNEGTDVESCIRELEEVKGEALKCYDDIGNLDSDIVVNFSEMMLLDGCFLIEFIREITGAESRGGEDLIVNLEWMIYQVYRDILLLENQLPFFVLTMLHDMTKHPTHEENFIDMVRPAFSMAFRRKGNDIPIVDTKRIEHLLHVVHMSCLPSEMKTSVTTNASMRKDHCCKISFWERTLQIITAKEIRDISIFESYHTPSAAELYEAGINFSKIGTLEDPMDRTTLFDIKFENGVMTIPCLVVENFTESELRNLIAYEQHSPNLYPCFTNYAQIMTQLINSHKDVNLLRRSGIICHELGDDIEVATIFKKLSDGTILSSYHYYEECSQLIQHCEKPWNQIKANLRHNYFNSPWAGASTVAAVILLILTVMQTVLAFTGNVK